MVPIPLIVGFGGINPAGRGSCHHAYRRMVIDALATDQAKRTLQSLAALMQLTSKQPLSEQARRYILDHTLIRRIEDSTFDPQHLPVNKPLPLQALDQPARFVTKARYLPTPLPAHWEITTQGNDLVHVAISGNNDFLWPSERNIAVQSAGQLPRGFDPGQLYPSRHHPRALEMTVYGASDALGSVGIDWEIIRTKVAPDQISVYAGSAMGQLDHNGSGGMLSARFASKRISSKQCPLGLAEMPADFINAYILGTFGATGACLGACASFLYNLRLAITDIQSGRARVALVGSSEAPVLPDVIEGYAAMGALATDSELLALDNKLGHHRTTPDYQRACRPFGDNCGFTLGESAQYVMLFDDALAIELGATVHGAVSDVFINADGYKKSIASPGVGNYITMAKALAAARNILGNEAIQQRSLVQAHGTGTPQNRVSESRILNQLAQRFGIQQWPVVAIKCGLGHSLGAAAGDQLINTLGIWEDGIIPGITTIDQPADDVSTSHLAIIPKHRMVGRENIDVAIINAKGFGGNNASATVLAPHIVNKMLANKYGNHTVTAYQKANEAVREQMAAFDELAMRGEAPPVYRFDYQVLAEQDLQIDEQKITMTHHEQAIDLTIDSPYAQLLNTD